MNKIIKIKITSYNKFRSTIHLCHWLFGKQGSMSSLCFQSWDDVVKNKVHIFNLYTYNQTSTGDPLWHPCNHEWGGIYYLCNHDWGGIYYLCNHDWGGIYYLCNHDWVGIYYGEYKSYLIKVNHKFQSYLLVAILHKVCRHEYSV